LTANATYIVTTTTDNATWGSFKGLADLPKLGDRHAEDDRLVCAKRTPKKRKNSKRVWDIQIEWNSTPKIAFPFPGGGEGDVDLPPVERPPRISSSSEIVMLPFTSDLVDGTAIALPTGEEFRTTPVRPVSVEVLSYSRYESTIPAARKKAFQNKVNVAAQTVVGESYAPKCILCTNIDYQNGQNIHGDWVWDVTYVFKIWPEGGNGWMVGYLLHGTYYYDADNVKIRFIDDFTQQPTTGLLDASGDPLGADDDPVLLFYNQHETADFSTLNLT
jgi:hypothetical protein